MDWSAPEVVTCVLLRCALQAARRIDAGQIAINDYWAGGIELPFGGNRKSGFGREKGLEGLEAYTRTKSIAFAV